MVFEMNDESLTGLVSAMSLLVSGSSLDHSSFQFLRPLQEVHISFPSQYAVKLLAVVTQVSKTNRRVHPNSGLKVAKVA